MMIPPTPLWNFTNRVSTTRRDIMMSVPNWQAVRGVVESHPPAFVEFEHRRDDLGVGGSGAKRASYRIGMSADDADIVYNSPVGLRAQFCLGIGVQRNRELLDALIPACLVGLQGADRALAELSLQGTDAKLCLDKNDIPNLEEIHIDYAPWIGALGHGERLAESGVLAPRVDAIWIKGAWILAGREWRDPLKADRDEKFRKFGFG